MSEKKMTGIWTDVLPIAVVLSVLLTIAGTTLTIAIYQLTNCQSLLLSIFHDEDAVTFLIEYASMFGIWIVFILAALLFKANRPMLKAFGYHRDGNSMKAGLIGLLLGFACNGFCILMSCILGDIKLYFYGFNPGLFFAFLFVVLLQSGAEEIADRCYLYQKLRRRYRHPAVAIITSSAVFAALHLLNPGITVLSVVQLIVTGLIFSLFVYYFDSLWAAIMMHTGWNFTQSIVFGLPNSGMVSKYSLFKLDAASARNGLFYNVGFGVEGSLGAVIILIGMLVVVFIIGYRKGEKKNYWA